MNAEAWQQESGPAFCVGCAWQHGVPDGLAPAAGRVAGGIALRMALVRLSGRQMKHRVESTAPALLAGLERLLAIDDLM